MLSFEVDFYGLLFPLAVTPAQHLLAWFTPELRQLVNYSAVDRLAKKTIGTFSNFLEARNNTTLERAGVTDYYPVLLLLGYLPPSAFWTPTRTLTSEENSSDIRTWFTPERRELLNLTKIDKQSHRSRGMLIRYLNKEPHLTLKILGQKVYYPVLQLVGFVPPSQTPVSEVPFISAAAAQHLLTWFTPERRALITTTYLDKLAHQPDDTFSRFLAGHRNSGLPLSSIQDYYQALRPLGYRPDLDLSQDESVRRHLLEQRNLAE